MKEKIEQAYIEAINNDIAPNVFADIILKIMYSERVEVFTPTPLKPSDDYEFNMHNHWRGGQEDSEGTIKHFKD